MTEALTVEELSRVRRLAAEFAGIALGERHHDLLDRRARRLGGRERLMTVMDAAELGDGPSRQAFIQFLTINHTGFFRHPRHFDIAAEHTLWSVDRRGQARLWCAATSTGEEAYSVAMATIELLDEVRDGSEAGVLPVEVLATDIDEAVIAEARRGEYRETALAALSPDRRLRFFAPSKTAPKTHLVGAAVRRIVRCEMLNLIDAAWPGFGPFDVIFCRNVLMYLTAEHRYSVLEGMTKVIMADGLLFIDPIEYLGPAQHLFETVGHGIYRLRRCHRTLSR